MDCQWFAVLSNAQRAGGIVTGEDGPEGVGVGVIIISATELVNAHNEIVTGIFRACHEAGIARVDFL